MTSRHISTTTTTTTTTTMAMATATATRSTATMARTTRAMAATARAGRGARASGARAMKMPMKMTTTTTTRAVREDDEDAASEPEIVEPSAMREPTTTTTTPDATSEVIRVETRAEGEYELRRTTTPKRFAVADGELLNVATAAAPIALRWTSGLMCHGYEAKVVDGEVGEGEYAVWSGSGKAVRETSDVAKFPRPEKPLKMYQFQGCPFCKKVREAVISLDLDVITTRARETGRNIANSCAPRADARSFRISSTTTPGRKCTKATTSSRTCTKNTDRARQTSVRR